LNCLLAYYIVETESFPYAQDITIPDKIQAYNADLKKYFTKIFLYGYNRNYPACIFRLQTKKRQSRRTAFSILFF